jgi:Cu-Zn family superoxide dismutase
MFIAISMALMAASAGQVEIRTVAGATAGQANVRDMRAGLRIRVAFSGMTPGRYGAHVHAVGRCEGPDFASAGPHWNPAGRQHGRLNPQGHHAGDLPNIDIGPNGRGALTFTLAGGTLAAMADADGASIVIHAAADDERTDPSGNSGARTACGVLAPPH